MELCLWQIKREEGVGFATPLGMYPYTVPLGHSNFYISKDRFYFQPYGYALPIGAPYKYDFDNMQVLLIILV